MTNDKMRYCVQATPELVEGWIGPLVRADGHLVVWIEGRSSIYVPEELYFDLERLEARMHIAYWLAKKSGLDPSQGVHFGLFEECDGALVFKVRVMTFHSALWDFEGLSNDHLEALKQVIEYEVSKCT